MFLWINVNDNDKVILHNYFMSMEKIKWLMNEKKRKWTKKFYRRKTIINDIVQYQTFKHANLLLKFDECDILV